MVVQVQEQLGDALVQWEAPTERQLLPPLGGASSPPPAQAGVRTWVTPTEVQLMEKFSAERQKEIREAEAVSRTVGRLNQNPLSAQLTKLPRIATAWLQRARRVRRRRQLLTSMESRQRSRALRRRRAIGAQGGGGGDGDDDEEEEEAAAAAVAAAEQQLQEEGEADVVRVHVQPQPPMEMVGVLMPATS
jgi:hypothetical protein